MAAITKIQLRRDTLQNWTDANPILSSGEIGIILDKNKFKIGDGSTLFNDLPIFGGIEELNELLEKMNNDLITLFNDYHEMFDYKDTDHKISNAYNRGWGLEDTDVYDEKFIDRVGDLYYNGTEISEGDYTYRKASNDLKITDYEQKDKVKMKNIYAYSSSKVRLPSTSHDSLHRYYRIVELDKLERYIPTSQKEEFKFTIKSAKYDDGQIGFQLPTNGDEDRDGINDWSYDWTIDWGDGSKGKYSGKAKNNTGIWHTYAEENNNYQITIMSNNDEYAWGRAFNFMARIEKDNILTFAENLNYAQVISLDTPITEKMLCVSEHNAGNNFGYYMFYRCSNMTLNDSFNLPQDITTVGNNFCSFMFTKCSSIKLPENFNLPQNIEGNVGNYFMAYTFENSSLASLPEKFNLPQGITEVGNRFLEKTFRYCDYLKYFPSTFKLPQNIVKIGKYFLYYTFDHCTELKKGVINFFGNLEFTQEQLDLEEYYPAFDSSFAYCINLEEEISPNIIPMLKIIPTKNNGCFYMCDKADLTKCPNNWKAMKAI